MGTSVSPWKEAMNLGNKYAKSYSSKNPPPRAADAAAALAAAGGGAGAAAAPTFMDDLGMDKEPTRKAGAYTRPLRSST